MRHKKSGRKLGRTTAHRQALGRNILRNLFQYGQIVTTVAKAKNFASLADKMITIAKRAESKIVELEKKLTEGKEVTAEIRAEIDRQAESIRLSHFRRALAKLHDRKMVQKLFYDIAPIFKNKKGGYTTVLKLSKSRIGDNTQEAILKLSEPLPAEEERTKTREQRKQDKEKNKQVKEDIKRKRKDRKEKEKEREKVRKQKEREKAVRAKEEKVDRKSVV